MEGELNKLHEIFKSNLTENFLENTQIKIASFLPIVEDFNTGLKGFQKTMNMRNQWLFDELLTSSIKGLDIIEGELKQNKFKSLKELHEFFDNETRSNSEGVFLLNALISYQSKISSYKV